jgi:hypothetical protein
MRTDLKTTDFDFSSGVAAERFESEGTRADGHGSQGRYTVGSRHRTAQ